MTSVQTVEDYVATHFEQWANETVVESCRAFARAAGHGPKFLERIKFKRTGLLTGWVELDYLGPNNEPIGLWIEEDTKAHDIEGNPILHWVDEETGEDVFRAHVHHPGTKGQHIMKLGAKFGFPRLQQKIIDESNRFTGAKA